MSAQSDARRARLEVLADAIETWDGNPGDDIRSLLRDEKRLREALQAIVDLKPEEFAFPADWNEQIAACKECKRWKGHPIQQGICDTHRRPLWDREAHDKFEERAIGPRAKGLARAALSTPPEEKGR